MRQNHGPHENDGGGRGELSCDTESSEPSEPPPSAQHQRQQRRTILILDVDSTTESPSEERDEADVLNELIGGSYATGGFPTHSWSRRPPGSGSYSSIRSWASVPDDGMSSNPMHAATESLRRSSSQMSLVGSNRNDTEGSAGRLRTSTRQDLAHNMAAEGEVVQELHRDADKMDTSLPVDDGMRALRQKLHEIRTLAVSTEEKAQRMHCLMTQSYLAHRAQLSDTPTVNGGVPIPVSSLAPPIDEANPYNLQSSDLEPSFSPLPVLSRDADGDHDESMEAELPLMLGCAHYKRNVKVQCFDCHRWFPCRHCHDQSRDLPFPHPLNRKKTQNMLCMLCRTPQPAAEMCSNCGEYAAWYYCSKCKLWDNDSNKRIYHCDDCGICRVGEGLGKDYVHCRRCNVCISISTSASHPCIERATEGDCPLCLVYLFESQTPVVSLPCGHYMHGECYRDLMAVTYKCPVCSKSAVNMQLQWRKLDDEIRVQPMPEDDDDLEGLLPHADGVTVANDDAADTPAAPRRPRTVYVGCNDCGRRSWAPFHWLGLKCQVCDSYNTNQMAPTAFEETEAERLVRQQQYTHRQHDFTGNAVLRDAGIGNTDELPVNNTLEVPTSPSQGPVATETEIRASDAQSPGRRYFVQEEEQRRPSFTSTRFSTPSIPALPNLPEMPRMPRMPNLPNLPNMPNLELPRFSPLEMFDAVSRSLSPMRFYLQGLDMRDEDLRRRAADRNLSPTSIRSDPTADATESKRRASGVDDEDVAFFGSDGHFMSDEGEATDESMHAVDHDDETSSSDSEDMSDTEMAEDDVEGGDDEEDMALFGHR